MYLRSSVYQTRLHHSHLLASEYEKCQDWNRQSKYAKHHTKHSAGLPENTEYCCVCWASILEQSPTGDSSGNNIGVVQVKAKDWTFWFGSFCVKSSKTLIHPDITDSDLLEVLHSSSVPWKKMLPNFFLFGQVVIEIRVVKVWPNSRDPVPLAAHISGPIAPRKIILLPLERYLKVLSGHPIK